MLPLIERLAARGPALLLTTGTVTAAEVAGRRLPRRRDPSVRADRHAGGGRPLPRSLAARPRALRRIGALADDAEGARSARSFRSRSSMRACRSARSAPGAGSRRSRARCSAAPTLFLAQIAGRRRAAARARRRPRHRLRQPEIRRAAAAGRRRRRSTRCGAADRRPRRCWSRRARIPARKSASSRRMRELARQGDARSSPSSRRGIRERGEALAAEIAGGGPALGRRSRGDAIGGGHRHLSCRYDRRDGIVVQARRRRFSRRVDGAARRAEPDRAGEAAACRSCTGAHVGNFRDVYDALAAAKAAVHGGRRRRRSPAAVKRLIEDPGERERPVARRASPASSASPARSTGRSTRSSPISRLWPRAMKLPRAPEFWWRRHSLAGLRAGAARRALRPRSPAAGWREPGISVEHPGDLRRQSRRRRGGQDADGARSGERLPQARHAGPAS